MGERKVVQKYYPPDFDPSLLKHSKKTKRDPNEKQKSEYKIRFMMPMSVRCLTCGEYVYRGKKFNARKETVQGEDYLGIRVFRFYVRCTRCSTEFTIKTDPKDSDYIAEVGCTKNFEPWKDMQVAIDQAKAEREEEEKLDATKVLENRAKDSKREMDILEALEDIRHTNARANQVTPDQLWEQHLKHFAQAPEEDAAELQKYYESRDFVRRLDDEEEASDSGSDEAVEGSEPKRARAVPVVGAATAEQAKAPEPPTTVLLALPTKKEAPKSLPIVVIKAAPKAKPAPPPAAKPAAPPAGLGLLSGYGSASD